MAFAMPALGPKLRLTRRNELEEPIGPAQHQIFVQTPYRPAFLIKCTAKIQNVSENLITMRQIFTFFQIDSSANHLHTLPHYL